jgi:hypothetical protein
VFGALGQFRFAVEGDSVRVSTPSGTVLTPRTRLGRGLRSFLGLRMQLEGQVEFEGGLFIRKDGGHFVFRVGEYRERFAAADVERLFRELVPDLGA